MKFKTMLVVLLSLSLFAVACDKKEEASAEGAEEAAAEKTEEKAAEEEAGEETAEKADEAKADEKEAEGDKVAMVEVPKEGKAFDPPVEKAQIPEGAWFCDMGTVHYARMEKGDGVCPECNMKLKQKAGGEKAEGEKAEDDHAGHNH
ncbi:hypothetical protein FIV42_05175 [Persicimonas caeni]|uniref:Uncharacterized protein n=1 Tax=Persicimonas caeni TaxID=2292766 RepID=A0A4Y6PP83_PERCE|nr:hypothetical protein [Persicimonas caeni]QDG50146.1 hypothetical protein FIV42_05175 [Persicimonas caeni]QED31367.1 hypothetical protein FRD00_05170 [Persicimonas caeni]